jgi:hypothetical protein
VSVQSSQSSIKRGQKAAYVVQVSTENGSASGVSVALTSQPSSQKPEFTSGCAKGDGTASCTVGSVTVKTSATLHAQIAVASGANSVSSVKLTATASVATKAKWTPPAAAGTVAVTSGKASPTSSSSPGAAHLSVLPLGPIPNLNGEASLLIGAGSASSLFPSIAPVATPSSAPGVASPTGRRNAAPVSESSSIPVGTPVATAQVVGLIVLGLAIMLTVTRVSWWRKRSGSTGPRS